MKKGKMSSSLFKNKKINKFPIPTRSSTLLPSCMTVESKKTFQQNSLEKHVTYIGRDIIFNAISLQQIRNHNSL